ncbi:MAG: esterase-like activity of phytase family protein [Lautropia sp.]|nr:esterase-like activity of phytase family protein [Lautropia sp.]
MTTKRSTAPQLVARFALYSSLVIPAVVAAQQTSPALSGPPSPSGSSVSTPDAGTDAQQAFPATLAGHAALPALTLVKPPADAPASLQTSGKYTSADLRRNDTPQSVEGKSFLSDKAVPRKTGVSLPFSGQPVQGMSGIRHAGKGRYWVTSDNGFGAKADSPDAMLMFHEMEPDWKTGKVQRLRTIFLSDPDRKLPFHIVNEGTDKRYLTGSDLDIESIQPVDDGFWLGDEFGPWLVKINRQGKVLEFVETEIDGKVIKSPDHYAVTTPAEPKAFSTQVRRSRGYEGMALSKDGRFLYPMLEAAMWDEAGKRETDDKGREYLRILQYDLKEKRWTGRFWKYRLEANGHNIGDFNMIGADSALVVERDNGEGLTSQACNGPARPDCQNDPARFKRVYRIEMSDADAQGFVQKAGYVDLLSIADPDKRARVPTQDGVFSFPFVTIENVDQVDDEHIIVANDNNLPTSSGRKIGKNDDNEFILLKVPELLGGK